MWIERETLLLDGWTELEEWSRRENVWPEERDAERWCATWFTQKMWNRDAAVLIYIHYIYRYVVQWASPSFFFCSRIRWWWWWWKREVLEPEEVEEEEEKDDFDDLNSIFFFWFLASLFILASLWKCQSFLLIASDAIDSVLLTFALYLHVIYIRTLNFDTFFPWT